MYPLFLCPLHSHPDADDAEQAATASNGTRPLRTCKRVGIRDLLAQVKHV